MLGGYLLGEYALDHRVLSTVPLVIIVIGTIPLGMAFGALNNYRTDISIASTAKDDVDEILTIYNIQYTAEIQFGKEVHGKQDVYIDLKIKGRG